jgi:hypothetical protein
MRRFMTSAALVGLVVGAGAGQAHAQPGTTAATPFQETSAGRAMRRITFAAIDCVKGDFACPADAFTTSGLFDNGTYQDTRFNYGGNLNQGDVSNSLLLLVLTQSQTFPNPSTASGFTFRIGGVVPVRESDLYGPLFGERALTNGRKQLSVTFNINQLRFRSIDGSSVRNGQRGLLWGDTNYDANGGGYVGICRMDINTTIAFAAANYGLLDALDVSVAVPVVHTSVEGSNEYLDYQYKNGAFVPTSTGSLFTFEPQGRYYVKGSSTGLGDIAVGAKYAFVRRTDAGAAVTVRTSLPTGSLDDMTGTGEFQTAVGFIGSFEKAGVSPHLNISYLAAAGVVLDELNYNVGLSYRLIPRRLTVGGEFVARRVYGVTEFGSGVQVGVLESPITHNLFEVRDFKAEEVDVNLFFFAVGGKLRLAGGLLASIFAVVPAGQSGLQVQRPTLNLGLNYTF